MMSDHAAEAAHLNETEYLDRDAFEALVIGSGFGGAVATCRLAQAGVDVAVVERGRRWPPGSFSRDLSRLDDGWLWACEDGLYDVRPLNDILAVQAAGYGGGSLVYANVAMRPPAEVFDEAWPEPYSRQTLDPYFELVSHMLDVGPVSSDPQTGQLPPKTRFMARMADALGEGDGFFHPNLAITFDDDGPGQRNRFGVAQRGCQFVGECDIGCNVGAKNSLDHNYLAVAEQHGAAVGVRTEAVARCPSREGVSSPAA
jgi:cholesterol oxidase